MLTIRARVASARQRLEEAGIPLDEAELDARLLAEFVLGWSTERYFTDAGARPPDGFSEQFGALVVRRAAHEPFAYIVGRQEFWGLEFEVTPAVLIPRPETELIVEAACEFLPDGPATFTAADVGTGSGCLVVAIARERPRAAWVATDISEAALEIARRNAARHGVADRIRFLRADLLQGAEGPFDLIVANPPYVREVDRADLQLEVRREPERALFAGLDGLDVIRRLLPHAAERMKPDGRLILECGFGQAKALGELILSTPGLTMIGVRRDLGGIPRIAIAARS